LPAKSRAERYLPDASPFTMICGVQFGCRTPLAELDERAQAPLRNGIGALVFRRGESFCNFRGLRQYKQKFSPHWELRYLTCPSGFETARVLADAVAPISGGIRGAIAK
jgi:phosphatidylglycerol lysyltransferase